MRSRISKIVAEAAARGQKFREHGVNVSVRCDGPVCHLDARHPTIPNKGVSRSKRGRFSRQEIRTLAKSVASEGLENVRDIISEAIITAKTLARKRTIPVEVTESGWVTVSGVRNGIAQVWRGDFGKIIGDDGNRLTMMLNSSGRVIVPKTQFDDMFREIPDEELVFSGPYGGEMIY